jgi:hypothetical protein
MVNYKNSIIYKICCKDPTIKEIYVGSTTNFKRRKNEHKTSCNNSNGSKYKLHLYTFIRNNGGFNNWDMVLIENFECNEKLELLKRERYYLELLEATLNRDVPSRSKEEYTKDYKEKNKDIINEKAREKYNENKQTESLRKKDFYFENKEKVNKRNKDYYENNKREIEDKNKQKVICNICKKEMRRDSLLKHTKHIHK